MEENFIKFKSELTRAGEDVKIRDILDGMNIPAENQPYFIEEYKKWRLEELEQQEAVLLEKIKNLQNKFSEQLRVAPVLKRGSDYFIVCETADDEEFYKRISEEEAQKIIASSVKRKIEELNLVLDKLQQKKEAIKSLKLEKEEEVKEEVPEEVPEWHKHLYKINVFFDKEKKKYIRFYWGSDVYEEVSEEEVKILLAKKLKEEKNYE